jgi:TM2 domain-containing membrane protein YozV
MPQTPDVPARRDADFSAAVLEDLFRYPRKGNGIAYVLWLLTGVAGGHRFYLDRTVTGLLMLFTGGGAAIWWLVDLFYIRKLVTAYNDEQAGREATGRPPKALSFMPMTRGATLPPLPTWVEKRRGRARLIGDVLVLAIAGIGVGLFTSGTGNFEPAIVIIALSAIILLGARWNTLATIPILRVFDRWSHRLRLFYYVNDPGGPLTLFFRPITGILSAPFVKRARAEAWLYLELGAWFTIIFTGIDVLESIRFGSSGIDIDPGVFLGDLMLTFASIYAFAAPIGAILTTHILLEKRDIVVWGLTGVAVVAMLFGMIAGLIASA